MKKSKIGWIGAGRMGYEMAAKLAKAGCDIVVWNRTRAKAEPLAAYGAKIANELSDLVDCDIVFTMVATYDDLKEVLIGAKGLYASGGKGPAILVESTSISLEGSVELRQALAKYGCQMLAAPVSGNAKVIKAGKLSFVTSGPQEISDACMPFLDAIAPNSVSYVGEGELSRIAKICHNVFLGVVTQSLSEITVLAEKAGLPRHAFLDFINKSVMGSTFSRYKTPAFVNLDFKVTFTPYLMRKDMDLGLNAGRRYEVPMPLASITRDLIQSQMGNGYTEEDFSTLLLMQAKASGLDIKSENVKVNDGLS
jgi:3-hydroxyisobutyrate dehydrogenase-like beta-hydroxyacid dehydrogenase